jgi:hypothetical protein
MLCIDSRLDAPLHGKEIALMHLSDTELGKLVRNAMRSIHEARTDNFLMTAGECDVSLTDFADGWHLTVENRLGEEDTDEDD